jgi:hypothetical protein
MEKGYILISGVGEKGYVVGLYSHLTNKDLLDSSSLEPNFSRAIKKITDLIIDYPEMREDIRWHFGTYEIKEGAFLDKDGAMRGLQKLVKTLSEELSGYELNKKIVLGRQGIFSSKQIYNPLEEKRDHPPHEK